MFSGCVLTSRGERLGKSWRENIFPRIGRCFHPHHRTPKPTDRQKTKGNQAPVQKRHKKSSVQTYKLFPIEILVDSLVIACQENDTSYISTFLSTYQSFGTTREVLEVLFKMYGYFIGGGECQDQIKTSISSILGMWLDQYPDDFYELPDFPCLHLLVDYIGLNMPGSVLEQRAQHLLKNMKNSKPIESEAKGLELHTAEVEDVELEIAPLGAPETAAAVTAEEEPVPTPTPEPPCPSFVDTTSRLREEELSILTFPPKLVAEQLTIMDTELFKKVVPYHCLGSIWSQRNKKGKENLAPTVRATITHFNNVVHCVITTCLGDKTMKAPDRARVVEHWIEVARECLIHRNFSSLHAILSALQSSPVHRLKETWGEVSSRSFQTFLKLYKKNILSRDLLIKKKKDCLVNGQVASIVRSRMPLKKMSKFSTLKMNLKRAQDRQQKKEIDIFQGTVPYLEVFLKDLVILDTAMQDFLDGGLVNFQKRRKEFSVLQEIKLLQESCQHYTIVSQEQFGTWFQDFDHLSENQRYNISCELEPPAQVASNTHSSYKKT